MATTTQDDGEYVAEVEEGATCLATLSHKPMKCPLTGCGISICVNEVFRHFAHDHQRHAPYRIYNITKPAEELNLLLKVQQLKLGENTCVGFLAYAVKENGRLPAERGLCFSNDQLLPSWEHHQHHLPILVMMCRKSFYTFNGDPELEQELQHTADDPESEVYFFWLAAAETTKPVCVTVLLYNKARTLLRRSLMDLQNLADPQDPTEFLCESADFILLNHAEVQRLSKNGNDFIYCNLSLHEG